MISDFIILNYKILFVILFIIISIICVICIIWYLKNKSPVELKNDSSTLIKKSNKINNNIKQYDSSNNNINPFDEKILQLYKPNEEASGNVFINQEFEDESVDEYEIEKVKTYTPLKPQLKMKNKISNLDAGIMSPNLNMRIISPNLNMNI
jgi:hypothetical protein